MRRLEHTLRRRLPRIFTIALAAAVLAAAAGCGSSSSGSSGTGGGILRIGTTAYIDSLNPFVALDPQAYNAFVMEYPQLVQYGPGPKIAPDWAKSWSHSADGLTWTFHLIPGAKWSDGTPMTSADVVWTGNTILKYRNGPGALLVSALVGIKQFTAPDPNTVVITYTRPVAAVLANLEQFFILPEHVWSKYTGNDGRDLKSFFPEQHLPTVAGGPYSITKFAAKGTTVFRPNPHFYGPKSHAAAITLTYYTNSTSMIADIEQGNLDFLDQVPFTAAGSLKQSSSIETVVQPGDEVTNLLFNSNPRKPKNRELLDPTVKEAFEYAIPRKQIADVVFGGYAKPWANILSEDSKQAGWLNPDVQPLPYDPAKANQILDGLGYAKGGDGVRVVPATTGAYAQPAHRMSYPIIVPNDLDFNGNRQFAILQTAFAAIGVHVTEVPGGDTGQAYSMITAPGGKYLTNDMATWFWHPYIDPNFNLSVVTKAQWNNNSDTGFDDPTYDAWYAQQARTIDFKARQALVWKMQAYLAQQRPYIQLIQGDLITAHDKHWDGFLPELGGYCKCYYTSPHQVG